MRIFFTVLFFMFAVPACSVDGTKTQPQEGWLAIRNVNVVSMASDQVTPKQTVLIKDGKIEAMYEAGSRSVPKGYQVIEGQGQYLMPGLADMHTHVRTNQDLALNVYSGVTTILNLGGPSAVLKMREATAAGQLVGPQIFAGAFLDNNERSNWWVKDVPTAIQAAQEAKAAGWDVLKVYNSIPKDAFFALVEEAKKQNIPVTGHGVRDSGLKDSLLAGQKMVAHAEEYIYAYFGRDRSESKAAEIIDITKKEGVYLIPNLSTYSMINAQYGKDRSSKYLDYTMARPETAYLSADVVNGWKSGGKFKGRTGNLDEEEAFLYKFSFAIYEAGVPLMAGTDTPLSDIIGMVPGFNMYHELDAFHNMGLSNYEALKTATVNPGQFVKQYISKDINFGMVKEGFRADLLLLKNNPLEDLSAVKTLDAVVLQGKWLDKAALSKLLEVKD